MANVSQAAIEAQRAKYEHLSDAELAAAIQGLEQQARAWPGSSIPNELGAAIQAARNVQKGRRA